MNVSLTVLVHSENKATAYAVVAPLATTGKKGGGVMKAIVQFSLNGKGLKPCTTDEAGLASCELADLKIGQHTVNVTVLGQNPPLTTQETITIATKTRKPTGPFGLAMMALFWVVFLAFGPGLLLTLTYLALTMIVLKLIARIKGMSFWTLLGNNNWVFFAVVGMALMSAIMASFNPLRPAGLFGWFSSNTSLVDSVFWGTLNKFFFGKSFTNAWKQASTSYFLWSVLAFGVSFSDEMLKFLGKLLTHLKKGEPLLNFALKDGLMELVWGVLKRRD